MFTESEGMVGDNQSTGSDIPEVPSEPPGKASEDGQIWGKVPISISYLIV